MTHEDVVTSPISAALKAIVVVIALIATAAFIAGFGQTVSASGKPVSAAAMAILAALIALFLGLLYLLAKAVRRARRDTEPVTPRERSAQAMIGFSAAAGVVIAVLLVALDISGDGDGNPFNGTMPIWLVIILLLFWVVIMPLISWKWHRSIDEHERESYRDGAFWAGYLLLMTAPAWWLLAIPGWVPALDGVVLFGAFAIVWCTVWMFKKYR